MLLEDFGSYRYSGIDRVGDDEHKGLGAGFGDAGDEISNYAGVDLEEVVAGHARFT